MGSVWGAIFFITILLIFPAIMQLSQPLNDKLGDWCHGSGGIASEGFDYIQGVRAFCTFMVLIGACTLAIMAAMGYPVR